MLVSNQAEMMAEMALGINRSGVHATVQRGRGEDTYCSEQERHDLLPQAIIPAEAGG